jgi:hypothetical protein
MTYQYRPRKRGPDLGGCLLWITVPLFLGLIAFAVAYGAKSGWSDDPENEVVVQKIYMYPAVSTPDAGDTDTERTYTPVEGYNE